MKSIHALRLPAAEAVTVTVAVWPPTRAEVKTTPSSSSAVPSLSSLAAVQWGWPSVSPSTALPKRKLGAIACRAPSGNSVGYGAGASPKSMNVSVVIASDQPPEILPP